MYVLVLPIRNRASGSGIWSTTSSAMDRRSLESQVWTTPHPPRFRSPNHRRKPNSPKIRSKEKPIDMGEREYYSSATPGPVRLGARTGLTRAPAAEVHDLAERLVGVGPHLLGGSAAAGGAEPDGRDD